MASLKRLIRSPAAKGLGVVAGTGLCVAAYEVFCPRATLFGQIQDHGSRGLPAVGLIFDRSPNPLTESICRTLHELESPATFFLEGSRADEFPSALQAMRAFDIGLHGDSYDPLVFMRTWQMRQALRRSLLTVQDLQDRPPAFLLPPYGIKDFRLLRVARRLGLDLVLPRRRLLPGPDEHPEDAVDRLLGQIEPGDIILVPWKVAKALNDQLPGVLRHLVHGLWDRDLKVWGLTPLLKTY